MKNKIDIVAGCMLMACLATPVRAGGNVQDPYDIIERHVESIGGMEAVRSINALHAQGTVRIAGSDLTGAFEMWKQGSLRAKTIVNWVTMQTMTGDNGEFRWGVDANGKIQEIKDDITMKQREVARMMENFEHLDPASSHFVLAYKGIEYVGDQECYVIEIANDINEAIDRYYYGTGNYYLVKSISMRPGGGEERRYSDFRRVDGIVFPFLETVTTTLTGEQEEYVYKAYTLNPSVEPGFFEPPAADVRDYVFTSGTSAENIPFDFIEDNVYVPVLIKGREELWVLDCGASVSVIDVDYAKSLGLEFQGPIKAQSATGVVDLFYVNVPSFSMQGITFSQQTILAMNIRDIFKGILGLEIAGILGYDFLSRFVTKIDYANEKLSFYHPDSFEYSDDGKVLDTPLSAERMFSIPATVDGKYSGRWLLDIGANAVDFYHSFARDHGLLDRNGVDIVFFGGAGPGTARRSRFQSMAVEDYVVHDVAINVPWDSAVGHHTGGFLIGNVGNTFLRHFVIYLDYNRQQVILEKGDDFNRRFPESKSGLGLRYNRDEEMEVLYVAAGTPAADAGFKKGDVVLAINRIEVGYFDGILAIRKLFREDAGTTLVFTIRRQGETMDLPLTLRDLL